jgi:hypothetical protein
MSCTVNLNDRITGASTGGYYVYLGWSVSNAVTENGEDSACHGIQDVLDSNDLQNPYGTNTGTDITVAMHDPIDQDLGNGNNIDFGDVNPGFYGFAYVVGDSDESGDLAPPECGDFTCFEIEVVPGVDMTFAGLDPICEANIATSGPNGDGTFDLSSLITGYVPGGNFSFPTVLGTLSGVILTLNPDAPAGPNYNVTYTINSSSLTSFHGQDVNCEECTGSVIITFEITEAQIAGTAVSLAVCN